MVSGRLSVERLAHRRPCLQVVSSWHGKHEAVDEPGEPGKNLLGDSVRLGYHREGPEHFVVDETAHVVPAPLQRKRMQFRLQIAPAVQLQNRTVRRRRAVEGNATANLASTRLHCLFIGSGHHEARISDLKVTARTSGRGES